MRKVIIKNQEDVDLMISHIRESINNSIIFGNLIKNSDSDLKKIKLEWSRYVDVTVYVCGEEELHTQFSIYSKDSKENRTGEAALEFYHKLAGENGQAAQIPIQANGLDKDGEIEEFIVDKYIELGNAWLLISKSSEVYVEIDVVGD